MIGFFLQATSTVVDPAAATTEESIRLIDILFKGGVVMIPLIILSLISIAFIISKYLFIRERSKIDHNLVNSCLLYTSPSPRDRTRSRMPSSA